MTTKLNICTLFLFLIGFSFSQTQKIKVKKQENMPANYKGNQDSLKLYINSLMARRDDLTGCMEAECKAIAHINKQGVITHVDLAPGTKCEICLEDLVLVLKTMPKWNPAKDKNGNPTDDKQEIIYKYKPFGIRIIIKTAESDTTRSFKQW